MGLDVGQGTVELFAKEIAGAKQLYGMDQWEYLKCLTLQKELSEFVKL